MVSKVDYIAVPTEDVERSRSFYVETLGLRPDDNADSEVWAGDTVPEHLGAVDVRDGARRARSSAATRRPT